uniref:Uncharacterized protein n=1 Tax=viral metagenome TaxID=1070528 RepID=A0A6C0J8X4_9ZZZZ
MSDTMNTTLCKSLVFARAGPAFVHDIKNFKLYNENGIDVKSITEKEYDNLDMDVKERLTEVSAYDFEVIASEYITGKIIQCHSNKKIEFDPRDLLEQDVNKLYSKIGAEKNPKIIPRAVRNVIRQVKGKKLEKGQFETKNSNCPAPADIICGLTNVGKTKFEIWFICSEPFKRLIDWIAGRTYQPNQFAIEKILTGSSTWTTATFKKYNEYVDHCKVEIFDIVQKNIENNPDWSKSTDEEYIIATIELAKNCQTIAEMNMLIFDTYSNPISETTFEDIQTNNSTDHLESCKKQFPDIMKDITEKNFEKDSAKWKKFTNEKFIEILGTKVEKCKTVSELNKLMFDTLSDPPYFENYVCPFYTLRHEESSKHYPFLIAAMMMKYGHKVGVFERDANGEYKYMIKTYNKPIGWTKLPSWV